MFGKKGGLDEKLFLKGQKVILRKRKALCESAKKRFSASMQTKDLYQTFFLLTSVSRFHHNKDNNVQFLF